MCYVCLEFHLNQKTIMPRRPGPYYEVDTPTRQHRDLRAAARSRKLGRDKYHKYVKYTAVDRGQANVFHYRSDDVNEFSYFPTWPAVVEEKCAVDRLSKRDFYMLARDGIQCRHHKPCGIKKDSRHKREVMFRRGSKYAKEQAFKWTKAEKRSESSPWWRWAADPWLFADHPMDLVHLPSWCYDPECDYCPVGVTMKDIVASRGACFVFNDRTKVANDVQSVGPAYNEDWSDVGSIASWDDFVDIMAVEDCSCHDESEWSEVEVE
jgi:hypothetical protein